MRCLGENSLNTALSKSDLHIKLAHHHIPGWCVGASDASGTCVACFRATVRFLNEHDSRGEHGLAWSLMCAQRRFIVFGRYHVDHPPKTWVDRFLEFPGVPEFLMLLTVLVQSNDWLSHDCSRGPSIDAYVQQSASITPLTLFPLMQYSGLNFFNFRVKFETKISQTFSARAFGAREYLFLFCVGGALENHAFVSACFWRVFKKLPVSYTDGRVSSLFLLNLKPNPPLLRSRLRRSQISFPLPCWGRAQHVRERVILERFQKAACFVHERSNSFNFLVKCEAKYPKFSPLAPSALANTIFSCVLAARPKITHS